MHTFLQLGDFGKTWQIAAKCGRRKELVKFKHCWKNGGSKFVIHGISKCPL